MYTPYAYNLCYICIFKIIYIFNNFFTASSFYIYSSNLTSYISKQWQNKTTKTEKYKSMWTVSFFFFGCLVWILGILVVIVDDQAWCRTKDQNCFFKKQQYNHIVQFCHKPAQLHQDFYYLVVTVQCAYTVYSSYSRSYRDQTRPTKYLRKVSNCTLPCAVPRILAVEDFGSHLYNITWGRSQAPLWAQHIVRKLPAAGHGVGSWMIRPCSSIATLAPMGSLSRGALCWIASC